MIGATLLAFGPLILVAVADDACKKINRKKKKIQDRGKKLKLSID